MKNLTVGILALQGCIEQHQRKLDLLGVNTLLVRRAEDLQLIDGLILPGGESTTMIKLADLQGLWDPLTNFCKIQPCWGICAGAILLATNVTNPEQKSLGAIKISAQRNAYGSQRESFKATVCLAKCQQTIEADFIRAPLLTALNQHVHTIAYLGEQPVGFQQDLCLATSFHTELGTETRMHQIFINLIQQHLSHCDHTKKFEQSA
jgi:5'-phosphate synthase pdxT subunit